jgi:hypothetical protein
MKGNNSTSTRFRLLVASTQVVPYNHVLDLGEEIDHHENEECFCYMAVTTTRRNRKLGDEIYSHQNDETDEHEGTCDSSWFRHPDHGLLTRLHRTSASPLPELLLARHGKRGLEEQRDQQSNERGGRFCNSHGRGDGDLAEAELEATVYF